MNNMRIIHKNILLKIRKLNNSEITLTEIEYTEAAVEVLELMDTFAELGPMVKHHDEELKVMLNHQLELCKSHHVTKPIFV
jgi:hypothetical protein